MSLNSKQIYKEGLNIYDKDHTDGKFDRIAYTFAAQSAYQFGFLLNSIEEKTKTNYPDILDFLVRIIGGI